MLRRRGLAPRYVPPVSLVLAADAKGYVGGLTAYREGQFDAWLQLFAQAVGSAAAKASELAARLSALQDAWRERAGRPRRDSAAEALIRELPARPIVTLATAVEMTGRSKQAANEAIAVLASAKVLKEVTLGKRNRAWEARGLFDLINGVARELATPPAGLRPGRPAPRGKGGNVLVEAKMTGRPTSALAADAEEARAALGVTIQIEGGDPPPMPSPPVRGRDAEWSTFLLNAPRYFYNARLVRPGRVISIFRYDNVHDRDGHHRHGFRWPSGRKDGAPTVLTEASYPTLAEVIQEAAVWYWAHASELDQE